MRNKKWFVIPSLAAFLMSAFPLAAEARSSLGITGVGVLPADQACYSTNWYSLQNSCSTTHLFNIPMVADTPGNHTFTITAYGPSSSSNVGCAAVGMATDHTSFWTSGYLYLPAFGSEQNIVATTYSPNNGGYFLSCYIGPGARVDLANYNP